MPKHPIKVAVEIPEIGSYRALAEILGVTKGAVHQWMTPGRHVPIEHCTAIEQATKGVVTRQMLRPDDWKSIWPELDVANDEKLSTSDRAGASDDVQPPVGGSNKGRKLRAAGLQEGA
jgi:DNA-binding transcriptional regulator YdaS (Cro superfamily)